MALFWTQKQDIGPSARSGHALTYDAARQQTILFGGSGEDDTWAWDGADWTQLQDIGPSARSEHALAYDSARERTVLFGGTFLRGYFADTWQWDGVDWTQVQDEGPSARADHAMCFDSVRGRVVLFGGYGSGGLLADTWEWDGTDWTQVEDEKGPSARAGHAMCFDAQSARTLLFGGSTTWGTFGGTSVADTWAFANGKWTQIADTGPPACGQTGFVNGGASFLFGGADDSGSLFGSTWELDGVLWTEKQDMGPSSRQGHGMSFDSGRGRVILFGGDEGSRHHPGLLGDTWELPVPAGEAPPGAGGAGVPS